MITWITDEVAIGDSHDAEEAIKYKFDATLNVAVDLDIKDPESDDSSCLKILRHKIGLVDGYGNDPFCLQQPFLCFNPW